MEQQVQDQITGSINPEAVLDLIRKKPKRNSYRKATKIVKNSVKGRKTKVTNEQGFRNYLQYTEPLLLSNNEVDQSDISKSLANLLNVFAPKKMETQKIQEIKKFVSTEITADPSDIDTEIENLNKNNAATKIQKLAKERQSRKKKEADEKEKQRQREDEAAATIQALGRGRPIRKLYDSIKPKLDKEPQKKAVAVLETGTLEQPLIMYQSPKKTLKYIQQLKEKDDKATKLAAVMKGHKARKEVKPFIKLQGQRMTENPDIKGSQVRRNDNGNFDKRAFGNNSKDEASTQPKKEGGVRRRRNSDRK